MATSEPLGITLTATLSDAVMPVYQSASGAPAFEVGAAYLMTDDKSLQAPIAAYDVGGPVAVDSLGRPVAAYPVKLEAEQPAPIAWQEFTLTAGDSGEWFGYSNGDIAYPPFNPPFGSISNEPTTAAELEAFYTDDLGVAVAIFQGDIQAQVHSLGLAIGGYAGVASDISLFGGNTVIRFAPDGINFQQGGEYLIEFINV